MSSRARSLSTPMTTRSGLRKSLTAAPSFKNSGLDATSNSMSAPRLPSSSRMAALTLAAVPTGTVDLVTRSVYLLIARPNVRATSRTYCRSAEPSSSGGGAHGREDDVDLVDTLGQVGGETEPPGLDVAADHPVQSRLVNGDFSGEQGGDFVLVLVDAGDVRAHFGEACSRHQTDVTGSYDCDIHVSKYSRFNFAEAIFPASAVFQLVPAVYSELVDQNGHEEQGRQYAKIRNRQAIPL